MFGCTHELIVCCSAIALVCDHVRAVIGHMFKGQERSKSRAGAEQHTVYGVTVDLNIRHNAADQVPQVPCRYRK